MIQEELVSIERAIPMRRVWAMPSANTFDIPPIRALVKGYLYKSKVSIDPFARNKRWATYTNDLNPETAADSHVDAVDFLCELKARGVIIFDPPYSVRQIAEVYENIGRGKATFSGLCVLRAVAGSPYLHGFTVKQGFFFRRPKPKKGGSALETDYDFNFQPRPRKRWRLVRIGLIFFLLGTAYAVLWGE